MPPFQILKPRNGSLPSARRNRKRQRLLLPSPLPLFPLLHNFVSLFVSSTHPKKKNHRRIFSLVASMGASGKWIKSLIGLKPSAENTGGKGRKWSRLWRSSSASRSGGQAASASEASETSSSADAFSSVVAAVVRAPPRDFRLLKREWAAVRIQTAFRAFLARRALRALRGIVRLQALVRGRRVRKQLAVTLKCMHALVRVQARARERRARLSADGRDSQDMLDEHNARTDPIKEAEEQWCDSQGTLDEVRSKIQMRHEAAMKRERAIAYALSHQQRSSTSNHSGRPSSPSISLTNHEADRSNRGWSYLEGWMATKPWESRLMEQSHTESPTNSQHSKSLEELNFTSSKLSDASSVKIRRNNVTTRVAAKPPSTLNNNRCGSQSASSSDFVCDESSPSTSSVTPVYERRADGSHGRGPNYMNLTKAARARLNRAAPFQRQGSGDLQYYNRAAFSSIDSQSNAGSELSVCSKRLNSMSLKGRSMTRSLDKENDDRPTSLF